MSKIAILALSVCIAAGINPTGTIAAESPAPSTQDSWTIRTSPIRVDAVLHAKSAEGFSFIFELRGTQGRQSLRTFISGGSLPNALDALHKAVEWHAPYLFINTNCNGNRTCGFYAVFEVQPNEILPLGQLMARGPVSSSYKDGHFIDYWGGERPPEYDWGLCMACQPQVKVILSETNGHFEVLPDQTWAANKASRDANEKTMAGLLREKHDDVNGDPTYYQALAENAVIDKYCGRNAELMQLLMRPHNDDVIAGLATVPVLQPPSDSRKPLDPGWYE